MKPQKCEGLPEDVMEEILSRVPVKSLLKFRCVSKSWRLLIDSKTFMKIHLQNSIKSTSVAHHRIILKTAEGLQKYSLPSLLNDPPFTDSISCDEINVEVGKIRLVGCCNGLVCILVDRTRFILWNPATRKSRNLPDFDNNMEYIFKYGFGLDEVSNDYKVFGVALGSNIGKVYSLRSNSWEVVEERDARLVCPYYDDAAIYVNVSGKLHWLIICIHDKCEIVSFDLNTHSYGVVELPSYYSELEPWFRLAVHKGCLIVLGAHQQPPDYKLDIWVMKEEYQYGVKQKETWHKLVIVPFSNPYVPYGFNLVTIAPNGEVLLICRSILKIYNPKYNLFRCPEIMNYTRILESRIYVESLASLDPDAQP